MTLRIGMEIKKLKEVECEKSMVNFWNLMPIVLKFCSGAGNFV